MFSGSAMVPVQTADLRWRQQCVWAPDLDFHNSDLSLTAAADIFVCFFSKRFDKWPFTEKLIQQALTADEHAGGIEIRTD